ncbi:MAG: hypothetical protein ACTSP4_03285 [Candidatus Hodarchaeales archaeon]
MVGKSSVTKSSTLTLVIIGLLVVLLHQNYIHPVSGLTVADNNFEVYDYPSEPTDAETIRIQVYCSLNESLTLEDISVKLQFNHSSEGLQEIQLPLDWQDNDSSGMYKTEIGPFPAGTLLYNVTVISDSITIWSSVNKEIVIKELSGLIFGTIDIFPENVTTADVVHVTVPIQGKNIKSNSVILHYRSSIIFEQVIMTQQESTNIYEAYIGPFNLQATVDYYITAENTSNMLFESYDDYFIVVPAATDSTASSSATPAFNTGILFSAFIIMIACKKKNNQ